MSVYIDNQHNLCYSIITARETGLNKTKRGEKVEDKIKELVKLVGQLNKLMLKVIELLGYTTLAEMAVKTMIQIWRDL